MLLASHCLGWKDAEREFHDDGAAQLKLKAHLLNGSSVLRQISSNGVLLNGICGVGTDDKQSN